MIYARTTSDGDSDTLPRLPGWAAAARADTFETVAFRSGAAFTVLDTLVSDSACGVPVALLANRSALAAASATSRLEGRLAQASDIRDAYHLTPAGDARGPDGDVLDYWRSSVRVRLTGRDWQNNLAKQTELEPAEWIKDGVQRAKTHGPLAGCTMVMRAVLEVDDRAERTACLLCDVVLARVLGWKAIVPLTAQGLTKPMLRNLVTQGQGADLMIQKRILDTVEDTIILARDLAQRANALRAKATKLRAKGSQAAVDVFLAEDAVAPSTTLSPVIKGTATPMTGRSARRFCDRLVELGVARELTGRPTFRLYGL